MAALPGSWTSMSHERLELVDCPGAVPHVQRLFSHTHWSAWTRDRRDRAHEGHSVPKEYYVDAVQRVQNPALWRRYAARRGQVTRNGPYSVKTSQHMPEGGCSLEAQLAEAYLFHGTSDAVAQHICANGFDTSKCNDGLFGRLLCFADSCTKADEYSGGGSQRTMLICRVALGKPFCTKDQTPAKAALLQQLGSGHDSIHGDRTCTSAFQEFAIADGQQAYPEYLVRYRRSEASESKGFNF
mmetsp:Transcript_35959/g.101256  ORF Transcript_35959/g.101256 Transcript_35959/m.101256 type:complete len:241 (-) Transcript_35959:97-819(-)